MALVRLIVLLEIFNGNGSASLLKATNKLMAARQPYRPSRCQPDPPGIMACLHMADPASRSAPAGGSDMLSAARADKRVSAH